MTRTEEQNWEKSFQTGPRLTSAEAHRLVVLRQRLTELRYLSLEYLLRRAASSASKGERTAWQSVWALVVFSEHHKRFPRQGELYPYLHKVLDESKTLEDLQLPTIDTSFPAHDSGQEAQKSLSEQLRSDASDLRTRRDRALAKIQVFYTKVESEHDEPRNYNSEVIAEWLRELKVLLQP